MLTSTRSDGEDRAVVTLPNFIYIGPAKAGSTWLHETLIRHPNVFLTGAKDLHFFDRYFDRGMDWYAAQFADALPEHQVVGEVCQNYLASPDAAARMHACLGDAVRLMVTLRNPVQRAFSHYQYMLRHGERPGSFRHALETHRSLIKQCRYARDLERYLAYFPRESIYVGLFDDLRADPQTFLDGVLGWLGLPPMVLEPVQRDARLPASEARSSSAARAVHRYAVWARDHDRAGLVGRLKRSPLVERLFYQPVAKRAPLTEEDAAYVRGRLERDVIKLERLVGMPLRERWGWPDTAPAKRTKKRRRARKRA